MDVEMDDVHEECFICSDKFTKKARRPITCPRCKYMACLRCVQKYELSHNKLGIICMNTDCAIDWPIVFVHEQFSKAFLKKMRKKITDILFNLDQGKIIEARRKHDAINLLHKEKRIAEDEINANSIQFSDIDTSLRRIKYRAVFEEDKNSIKEVNVLETRKERLQARNEELKQTINLIRIKLEDPDYEPDIRQQCPLCEKGRLDNTDMGLICNSCEKKVCDMCLCEDSHENSSHENSSHKNSSHECNEEDRKNVERMRKDSKQCPRCGIWIFRSEGCPQMWCTRCHIGFDWNTLAIVTGYVDNPHYFEWLSQNRIDNQQQADEVIRLPDRQRDSTLPNVVLSVLREPDIYLRIYHILSHAMVRQEFKEFEIGARQSRGSFINGRIKEQTYKEDLYQNYILWKIETEMVQPHRDFYAKVKPLYDEIFSTNLASTIIDNIYSIKELIDERNLIVIKLLNSILVKINYVYYSLRLGCDNRYLY